MATRALLVSLIGSLLLWRNSDAETFQCYSCTMSGAEVDKSCVNNPTAVTTSYPFVNCNKKYCIIIRMEYNDPPGKIFTFLRGCADYVKEGVEVDSSWTTYTRKCTSNLCNDWNGLAASPGGSSGVGSGSGSGGETGTIVTKGTGNGATAVFQLASTAVLISLATLMRFCL